MREEMEDIYEAEGGMDLERKREKYVCSVNHTPVMDKYGQIRVLKI
jgi:hypothetical protein